MTKLPRAYKTGLIVSAVMVLLIGCVIAAVAVLWSREKPAEEQTEEERTLYTWYTEEELPEDAEITETSTQYRFRKMEYQTGLEKDSLDGWEMFRRNTVWSDEIETTSDSVIMESDPSTIQYRAEVKYNEIENIKYNYKRWHYTVLGRDCYTYTSGIGNGEWEYKVLLYELPQGEVVDGRQTRVDEDGGIWFKAGVNKEGELTENETVTTASIPYTVYYFRIASYTYDFRRWGEYSGWSFTKTEENDETQVQQRTVYKVEE